MDCEYCGEEIEDFYEKGPDGFYHPKCYKRLLRMKNWLLSVETVFDVFLREIGGNK